MAFIESGFDSGPLAAKGFPKIMRYRQTADSLATILGATYFDDTIVALNATIGDAIFIVGSDGAKWIQISAVTDNTDVTTANLSA